MASLIRDEAAHSRNQNVHLCERCKELDFDNILGYSPEAGDASGRSVTPLGPITSDMENSQCSLCRLFAAVHLPFHYDHSCTTDCHQLRACEISALGPRSRREMKVSTDPKIILGVFAELTHRRVAPGMREKSFEYGVIADVTRSTRNNTRQVHLEAHLVDPLEPNYDQLRNWIDHCGEYHGKLCGLEASFPAVTMKFIHCFTGEIVQVSEPEEYFALSYVWGKTRGYDMSSQTYANPKHTRSSGFPRVVEDAMIVVRSLGRRYLWVDSCSIDQDNPEEKQRQIQNMGSIYHGACATIVAASGENADSGLSGVSCVPRQPQPSARIGPRHLVSTMPHASFLLKTSTWSKRGWCYQEAVLSRRCLIFTKHQVYFVCKGANCCEALDNFPATHLLSTSGTSLMTTEMFDFTDSRVSKFPDVKRQGLWEFFEHLAQYKKRNLTFDSDTLNAFQGLPSMLGYQSVWGIPIALPFDEIRPEEPIDYDIGFARGLWWDRSGADGIWLHRVPGFPSWSWAGWKGPIQPPWPIKSKYFSMDSKCNAISRESFDTHFSVELTNGRHLTLKECYNSIVAHPSFSSEFSHYLRCEATVVRVKFQRAEKVDLMDQRAAIAYVCACHPDTAHHEDDNTVSGGAKCDYKYDYFYPFANPVEDQGLFLDRLFSQLWDCVLIFSEKKSVASHVYNLLVVDRVEDGLSSSCIGNFSMNEVSFDRLQKTRKLVRIS